MMSDDRSNWVSYFLYGIVAIILSWAASGCILGNYKEEIKKAAESSLSDPFTGYYTAAPASLTFYAVTSSSSFQKEVAPAQVKSLIPKEIRDYLTNPVVLLMRDVKTGSAALTAPSLLSSQGTPYLPTRVNPDSTLTYNGSSKAAPLWQDPACQNQIHLYQTGALTHPPELLNASDPSTGLPLSGKLQLKLRMLTDLSGDCVPTLQAILDCYQNIASCGDSDPSKNQKIQTQIQEIFGPYLESEAITTANFPNLVQFAYDVSYE